MKKMLWITFLLAFPESYLYYLVFPNENGLYPWPVVLLMGYLTGAALTLMCFSIWRDHKVIDGGGRPYPGS